MAKLFFSFALALMASSTIAMAATTTQCTEDAAKDALAVISNTTNLNSCAPDSTWKLTSLFDAATLSEADFFKFCNASECMHPMHELLEDLPSCVGTFNGESINFFDKVTEIHDKCHEALEGGSHHDDDGDEHEGSGSHHHDDHDHDGHDHVGSMGSDDGSASAGNSTVPSPAPTSGAVIAAASTVVAVGAASVVLLL